MELQISPTMISWIAELEHTNAQTLANELAPKKVDKFLQGLLSKTTAIQLAKRANIPFGYLFLQTPPQINLPNIPDLRQTIGAEPLSADFFEILQDIEYKQDWFKEYLLDNGNEPLDFVGKFKFSPNLDPKIVVQDIINTLNIDLKNEIKNLNKDNYFKFLSQEFERIGILIFKNGVVKNKTNRQLSVAEFRGFALVDKIAPVVFINGSDSPSAQLFTLVHEVAHIWIGQSGVSSWNQDQAVESFCNKVAAEFLIPTDIFIQYWQTENSNDSIIKLMALFKVSKLAIIIKAVTLGLLSPQEIHNEQAYLKRQEKNTETAGGNFYNTASIRQSRKFSEVVLNQAVSQHLPLRVAGQLLNMHADKVMVFYRNRRGEN